MRHGPNVSDPDRRSIDFGELVRSPGVVEELELRSRFGFCAYHGGHLERQTHIIAREAAARSGSSYYAVIQPPDRVHHIPSTRVDPDASDHFRSFIDHCSVMVTIHGFGRRGYFTTLLCGGRNRRLASHVAGHLESSLPHHRAIHDIDDIPKGLRGTHPRNPCNLTVDGGMQLEVPPRIRGITPAALHWYRATNGRRFPLLDDLIDALAAAAETWPDAALIEPQRD